MKKGGINGVVRIGILVTAVLALASAPARAQSTDGGHEIRVSNLGSSNRFSRPLRTVDDVRAMANANWRQLTSVLTMAGLADVAPHVLDVFTAGYVTETTIAPGTRIQWMAIKRSGTPVVLQNVRWTGRKPFHAWQFA